MRLEFKKLQPEFSATILYVSHVQLEAMTMGDRIVVINEGAVQQIGTPREIFEHPANRFVAGFVGEPAMNFLPCQLRTNGGEAALAGDGFSLSIDQALAQISTANRVAERLIVGLRPQRLTLAHSGEIGSGDLIPGTTYAVETLGSATIVDVSVGGRVIRVQAKPNSLTGRTFQLNEPVSVQVDRGLVYLFDDITG